MYHSWHSTMKTLSGNQFLLARDPC